ncbi:hypothetical protein HDU93_005545 [Gonapodya sp. JEL0774]|nr:hypothetical protein HDU93_005545 [Gonapodya sp. JEL0774]
MSVRHLTPPPAVPRKLPNIELSHLGLHVTDMDKQLKFYTEVMGFYVMDYGVVGHPTLGENKVAFLSRDPKEHHQLALFDKRPEDVNFNVIQQISFSCGSVEGVKEAASLALKNGASQPMPMSHGHTISCYLMDPEGNRLELYSDQDWYVPQPYVTFIPDFFDVDPEELRKRVYDEASKKPGFVPTRAEYHEIMRKKMGL